MQANLNPKSTTSAVILTSTGSAANVASAVPFGIYTASVDFLSGASLQVNYVYKKLGGDVVDIELVEIMSLERIVDQVWPFHIASGVETLNTRETLGFTNTRIRQVDRVVFLVDLKVLVSL